MNWKVWLQGLVAAFIGGGATGVTAAGVVTQIDPEHFNLDRGLGHTVELMAATFLVSGLIKFFYWLKDHPMPDWNGVDRRT